MRFENYQFMNIDRIPRPPPGAAGAERAEETEKAAAAEKAATLPPRKHGTYYRRDVGAVALLLPVEETNLSHI